MPRTHAHFRSPSTIERPAAAPGPNRAVAPHSRGQPAMLDSGALSNGDDVSREASLCRELSTVLWRCWITLAVGCVEGVVWGVDFFFLVLFSLSSIYYYMIYYYALPLSNIFLDHSIPTSSGSPVPRSEDSRVVDGGDPRLQHEAGT